MKIAASFVRSTADATGLPRDGLAQLALVGRSNVGKSSLINALTGRKALARTSHTPGRTQELIFFDGPALTLVDMPGYGYAAAPKQKVKAWTALDLPDAQMIVVPGCERSIRPSYRAIIRSRR